MNTVFKFIKVPLPNYKALLILSSLMNTFFSDKIVIEFTIKLISFDKIYLTVY